MKSSDDLKKLPSLFTNVKEYWREYVQSFIEELKKDDQNQPKKIDDWFIRQAFGLEGLDFYLKSLPNDIDRLKAIRRFYEANNDKTKTEIGRKGPLGGNRASFFPKISFPCWLLQKTRVFDGNSAGVQKSLFEEPPFALCDLFIKEPGQASWMKFLPRLDLTSVHNAVEKKELEAFAIKAGAIASLDNVARDQWIGWLRRLKKHAGRIEPAQMERFLSDFLRHVKEPLTAKEKEGIRVPCFGNAEVTTIRFEAPDDVLILDDPLWNTLKDAIISEGKPLLLATMNDGETLGRLLGCEKNYVSKRLSAKLAADVPALKLAIILNILHKEPFAPCFYNH